MCFCIVFEISKSAHASARVHVTIFSERLTMKFENRQQPRIVYMGTPEISAIVFKGMLDAGFNIVGLVCNEDRPIGRKGALECPATKKIAMEHGIPVFQPHRIRNDYQTLADWNPDVVVTMAYGQIVPQAVLDIPRFGCINLHGSLLPKLRGAAPIQRSIMQGDTVTGVTLMEMVDKMDAGRMYDKIEVEILPEDNYSSLAEKIGNAAKELILRDLLSYLNGELPGEAQNEEEVTFAAKISPEDEKLSFHSPVQSFVNMVRGLSLTPGGYVLLEGKKFKILSAKAHSDEVVAVPGTIVSDKKGIFVQCEDGIVSLHMVQMEGKKPMDAKSFVNGVRDLKGKVFE